MLHHLHISDIHVHTGYGITYNGVQIPVNAGTILTLVLFIPPLGSNFRTWLYFLRSWSRKIFPDLKSVQIFALGLGAVALRGTSPLFLDDNQNGC